jgi:hypothetical protein
MAALPSGKEYPYKNGFAQRLIWTLGEREKYPCFQASTAK